MMTALPSSLRHCLFLLLIAIPILAKPCTCIGEATAREGMRYADRVFRGTVVKAEKIEIPDPYEGYNKGFVTTLWRYTLEVTGVYKGWPWVRKLVVTTGEGHGDCGFGFEEGKAYVVYADWRKQYVNDGPKVPKYLFTNICKRTTSLVEEEVQAIRERR